MSREYAVSIGGITIAGTTTLVFINPPATGKGIEILRCWVNQSANATSAQQRVQLVTQVTAFPTLTSATPAALKRSDSASVITGGAAGAAGTSGVNASAENGGTKTTIFEDAFNVITGYLWIPSPAETIYLPPGSASGFGLYLPVAPATLTNWAAGVIFREV